MNKEEMKGKWHQFKGDIRKRWGLLTDDEIDQIEGDRERLIGKIQEKYGRSREEAEHEVNDYTIRH